MIKSFNILVVEDNPLNQKILSFYLKKEHHSVHISPSGEEALELYGKEWFDIILMDIMLPGMNGFETTRVLRKMEGEIWGRRKTVIIALTANTLDNDRERCLQYGMDEYMPKPFDMKKLNLIFEALKLT